MCAAFSKMFFLWKTVTLRREYSERFTFTIVALRRAVIGQQHGYMRTTLPRTLLLLLHGGAVAASGPLILRLDVPPTSAARNGNLIVREFVVYGAGGVALTLAAETCGAPPCARSSTQYDVWAAARAFDGDMDTAFSALNGYG